MNKNTSLVVQELKENSQDFEWYPTTEEILNCVKSNISQKNFSLLDVGCGDGRSLEFLSPGTKYAIEKSMIHINNLPPDVFIVGTEFYETTFIDKEVDIIFCNPPYSEYLSWMEKIIKEANAKTIFLVVPDRWRSSKIIQDALKFRESTFKILGTFDFISGDRASRANVDVVQVDLSDRQDDPFKLWFRENFKIQEETPVEENIGKNVRDQLVKGKSLIETLAELYRNDLLRLTGNYKSIQDLDPGILKELGVDLEKLMVSFREKISGLKKVYWKELFQHYEPITKRLTHKTRTVMLSTLNKNVSIDFTEMNIYAVTAWAIKNANQYFDTQLVDVVKGMVDKGNVVLYKSNQRTLRDEEWRYKYEAREKMSQYGLELRIILENFRAIQNGGYSFEHPCGLHESAHILINDIITISGNLGYESIDTSFQREWVSNKSQNFQDKEGTLLFSVKAFLNGNIHIKFNQGLIKKLNVEFGRLMGWLKNWEDASKELNISEKDAKLMFRSNFKMLPEQGHKLLGGVC